MKPANGIYVFAQISNVGKLGPARQCLIFVGSATYARIFRTAMNMASTIAFGRF